MDHSDIVASIHELDKRLALQEQKVDEIYKNVARSADALSWLAKITGASILGAVMTWVLKGGLSG